MTFKEFTGKNVEEAIRTAMREFAADLSDLDIEILAQGSRSILGVGGEEARILAAPKSAVAAAETIRVSEPMAMTWTTAEAPWTRRPAVRPCPSPSMTAATRSPSWPAPRIVRRRADPAAAVAAGASVDGRGRGREPRGDRAATRAPADRPPREPRSRASRRPSSRPSRSRSCTDAERSAITTAQEVLQEMLRLMGVEATVEITMGSETSKLNVKGEDLGVLIGRRGEKLASLQHLVNLIVAKREGQWHRIAVDVENYRGRREEQLRDVAERAAKRVAQSGKIIQLEPMPAVERRIVHMALVENSQVRTQSVGVEPNRRIVVLPAGKSEA